MVKYLSKNKVHRISGLDLSSTYISRKKLSVSAPAVYVPITLSLLWNSKALVHSSDLFTIRGNISLCGAKAQLIT